VKQRVQARLDHIHSTEQEEQKRCHSDAEQCPHVDIHGVPTVHPYRFLESRHHALSESIILNMLPGSLLEESFQ
jgi:hypothetical protein